MGIQGALSVAICVPFVSVTLKTRMRWLPYQGALMFSTQRVHFSGSVPTRLAHCVSKKLTFALLTRPVPDPLHKLLRLQQLQATFKVAGSQQLRQKLMRPVTTLIVAMQLKSH